MNCPLKKNSFYIKIHISELIWNQCSFKLPLMKRTSSTTRVDYLVNFYILGDVKLYLCWKLMPGPSVLRTVMMDCFLSLINRWHFKIHQFSSCNKPGKLINILHNLFYYCLPMEDWYFSRVLIHFLLRHCALILGWYWQAPDSKDSRKAEGLRRQYY